MNGLLFTELIQKERAFRPFFDELKLSTAAGKKLIQQQYFTNSIEVIQGRFKELSLFLSWYQNIDKQSLKKISNVLSHILDISITYQRLQKEAYLDEVELYEIKMNLLAFQSLSSLLEDASFSLFTMPNVQDIVALLDPEKTNLPHFYLYNAYHPNIKELRERINKEKDEGMLLQLQRQLSAIESDILQKLSISLHPFADTLQKCLALSAQLDMLLAKSEIALRWNCCIPEISKEKTSYEALFHPIAKLNLQNPDAFQAIDLTLDSTTYLVTGANMAGKTILLKSIQWAQILFQFGFAIPAKKASIVPVEEIYFSAEENHSELSGLSSFAAEIVTVNHILQEAKKGRKLLVLIDELARTTNPEEGTALVSAYVKIISKLPCTAVITTHFNHVKGECKRLRIKGLTIQENQKITFDQLFQYMDYQPIEVEEHDVPLEALRIAEILEIDPELLALAKKNR